MLLSVCAFFGTIQCVRKSYLRLDQKKLSLAVTRRYRRNYTLNVLYITKSSSRCRFNKTVQHDFVSLKYYINKILSTSICITNSNSIDLTIHLSRIVTLLARPTFSRRAKAYN